MLAPSLNYITMVWYGMVEVCEGAPLHVDVVYNLISLISELN